MKVKNNVTNSTDESLNNETQYDKKLITGEWANAWRDTPYSETETREVRTIIVDVTKTQYFYVAFYWKDSDGVWRSSADPKSGVECEWRSTGWVDSEYNLETTYSDGSKKYRGPDGKSLYRGVTSHYWDDYPYTYKVKVGTKTQYDYRDNYYE